MLGKLFWRLALHRRVGAPDARMRPLESNPRLPGFDSIDEALQARIDRAFAAQGPGYVPRTHLLNEDGSPRYTNR